MAESECGGDLGGGGDPGAATGGGGAATRRSDPGGGEERVEWELWGNCWELVKSGSSWVMC